MAKFQEKLDELSHSLVQLQKKKEASVRSDLQSRLAVDLPSTDNNICFGGVSLAPDVSKLSLHGMASTDHQFNVPTHSNVDLLSKESWPVLEKCKQTSEH